MYYIYTYNINTILYLYIQYIYYTIPIHSIFLFVVLLKPVIELEDVVDYSGQKNQCETLLSLLCFTIIFNSLLFRLKGSHFFCMSTNIHPPQVLSIEGQTVVASILYMNIQYTISIH